MDSNNHDIIKAWLAKAKRDIGDKQRDLETLAYTKKTMRTYKLRVEDKPATWTLVTARRSIIENYYRDMKTVASLIMDGHYDETVFQIALDNPLNAFQSAREANKLAQRQAGTPPPPAASAAPAPTNNTAGGGVQPPPGTQGANAALPEQQQPSPPGKVSLLLHNPISAMTPTSGVAHTTPPSWKHSSTPLQQKVNIDRKHLSKGVRRTEEFNIHQSSGAKPEDNPSTQKQEEKQLARHNTHVPPAKPVKQSLRERHPATPTHGKAQSFRSVFPRQLRRPDNKASSEIVRKHSNFIHNKI
eukprot:CAMPEP_0206362800 /NCGR_PEP_ID=MMETSP0294-20121207/1201_1 /ASSEMBLY_ACC=CAM_ASM_000327 /TAXON_ID=39354 /ORGANISM="Heterosigma akashiwo, Strain CCMP2393" /LENGTH=299 /DNA_ID=CAMNT_0053808001 /DNA_START=531 /DNA_END=1430 /DNA_ORIENTATION=-